MLIRSHSRRKAISSPRLIALMHYQLKMNRWTKDDSPGSPLDMSEIFSHTAQPNKIEWRVYYGIFQNTFEMHYHDLTFSEAKHLSPDALFSDWSLLILQVDVDKNLMWTKTAFDKSGQGSHASAQGQRAWKNSHRAIWTRMHCVWPLEACVIG